MPVKEVTTTVYKTDDDQQFADQIDAVVHQAILDNKPSINAYIEQLPGTEMHHTKTRNVLMKFIQFDAERKFKEEAF